MKSVADRSREDHSRHVAAMTASDRIALALELGEQAIETYAAAQHVSREEARRMLRRLGRAGRRPSAAADSE